jgi:hypothetical protein
VEEIHKAKITPLKENLQKCSIQVSVLSKEKIGFHMKETILKEFLFDPEKVFNFLI